VETAVEKDNYLSSPTDPFLNSTIPVSLMVAEPTSTYQTKPSQPSWVEVLVDCPGVQGLYTYSLPADLTVQSGDIVSVPFGAQITGGIAIRLLEAPPADLDISRIRPIEDVITTGFFPGSYWQLLQQVAQYYCCDLMSVIRVALPPGLLGRSQRRIRLNKEAIPAGAETFCSPPARQILRLLQSQPEGDYSFNYLKNQIRGASKGIRELSKRGWLESYLEPPKPIQPKLKTAITLTIADPCGDLTPRQREILQVLQNNGGEMWLTDFLNLCRTTTATLKRLSEKSYVTLQEREILRQEQGIAQDKDLPKQLNQAQAAALAVITGLEGYARVLLHGVTGSGKTEVYLQAIAPLLEQGKSALVLVPEIGLTPQLTDRFRARFGDKVCVYHSALSDGERYDTWRQMIQGEPQVVIGTRSAVFAPLPQLSLIVLDEEHDSSFKQNQPIPTYHARTVANWRAELAPCPLILGSATPSLESWVAGRQGDGETRKRGDTETRRLGDAEIKSIQNLKSYYLCLPERIESRPLPSVEIVDMRQELNEGNRSIFSRSLQVALAEMKERRQQGILFIPRRGHSTFVSCRSCGYVMECPHCDVSLSYHYTHEGATKLLRCHYCNYTCVQPTNCPECSSPYLKFFGSGTQKVTQELNKLFPELTCIRFDSDTTRTKGSHRRLLTRFASGEADVLVGTQMLTKGIDLAGVTLVGILAADGLLHRSDYRAAERTFQTLTQVAGRAGRGDEPGKVIVQTYSSEHPVIKAVSQHDYDNFSKAELEQRAALNYPPFGKLILIKLSGIEQAEVQQTAEIMADECANLVGSNWEILGPAPASIMRIARRYRWHIVLKSTSQEKLELSELNRLRSLCSQSVSITIDVDPLGLE
jgi:primosomal protein N' (replication factor Y)